MRDKHDVERVSLPLYWLWRGRRRAHTGKKATHSEVVGAEAEAVVWDGPVSELFSSFWVSVSLL